MASTWYYAAGNRQVGPISEAELDGLVDSGAIARNTLVWQEGLTNWTAYDLARPDRPVLAATPPLPQVETSGPGDAQPTRFCTECGRATPERELAQFGARLVCATCKPAFAQQLRERGMAPARFVYAGFWIRFVARLIDSILMYIIILPVTFLVLGMRAFDPSRQDFDTGFLLAQIGLMIFNLIIAAGYEIWFVTNYSATPGKMAVGKKVILADGSPLTYGRSAARWLSTMITNFTFGIGYIMAAFDSEKRALHDRICDTRVVAK